MPKIVIKSDKTKEPYNEEKVKNSLKRINLSDEEINQILSLVNSKLPEVVTTKKLFAFIFQLLKARKEHLAYKFNLKSAIFRLGPSGYPFEKFIAHLFKEYGFEAKHNLFLKGKCLIYEIDVYLKNHSEIFIGECKFHNQKGRKNDVKVVLYSYARFLDIKENPQLKEEEKKILKPLVVTNTRFTSEAIDFSECYSIKLIAWNYPPENSLVTLIERKKYYPLTIFDFLNNKILNSLFQYDIVSLGDFLNKESNFLKKVSNLDLREIEEIKEKIRLILGE
ncbi:hypothetical protein HRbin35_00608 [bacterium HR35]|nr:hypothetical protein HRbin35_00608 [bacterium HR35]